MSASTKVISIVLKAVDQATAPMKRTLTAVGTLGSGFARVQGLIARTATGAAKAATTVTRAVSGVVRMLTSLRTVLVGGVAAFLAGRVVASLTDTVDELDELAERSRALAIPAEAMQVLEYAAKKANVESSELFKAFGAGTRALGAFATTGNGPAANVLKSLGIGARNAKGEVKSVIDLLPELQGAFDRLGVGQAQRQFLLGKVFGNKGGSAIERLLASGDFKATQERLQELNGIASPEALANAAKLSDAIDDLAIAWRGLKREIIEAIGPSVTALLNGLAIRISNMPRNVRGLKWAIEQALGGGEFSEEAGNRLTEIKDRVLDALWAAIKGIWNTLATALVTTVTWALEAAGPKLADVLRDAIAPVWNEIADSALGKRFGLEKLDKSLSGQLKQSRAELAAFNTEAATLDDRGLERAKRLAETAKLQQQAAFDAYSQAAPGSSERTGAMRVLSEMQEKSRAAAAELERMQTRRLAIGGDIERQTNRIAVLESQLAQEAEARTKSSQGAFRDIFKETGEAYAKAREELDLLVNAPAFVGPLAPGQSDPSGLFGMLDALGKRAEEVTPQVQDAAAEVAASHEELAARVARAFVSIFGSVKSGIDKAKAKLREFADAVALTARVARETQALEARALEAQGGAANAGRAAMIRQELTFAEERAKLQEQFGKATARVMPALLEAQRVERERLVLDQGLVAITDKLKRAEEEYAAAVEMRANLVEAGTLTQSEATLANENNRRSLLATLRESETAILALAQKAGPEFAAITGEPLEEVRKRIAAIKLEIDNTNRRSMGQGIRDGIRDIKREAEDVYGFARNAIREITSNVTSGLATAIIDTVGGVKSLKDAFREFLSSTLRMVAQLILQFLILRAIAGVMAGFGASAESVQAVTGVTGVGKAMGGRISRHDGPRSGRASGRHRFAMGLPGYLSGGMVAGSRNVNRDTVPIMAAVGEHVLSRAGVRANDPGTLAYMNHGGRVVPASSGGGGEVTVNIYMQGGAGSLTEEQVRAAAREGVLEGLRNRPGYRGEVRRYVGGNS